MKISMLSRAFERFRDHGDTSALARVFDATSPALLRVARRLLPNAAAAEDAVQSTFLGAIERAKAWDSARPVEPWLFGILIRQVGLQRRSAARVIDGRRLQATSDESDPADEAEREEIVANVVAALRTLPERDRAVLEPWLRGEDGASDRGAVGSTLRMRVHRALSRLRRALPQGLSAGVALTTEDHRALEAMRQRVVNAAASRTGAATATASVATSLKLLLAAGVATLVTAGALALRAGREEPVAPKPGALASAPRVAATPQVETATPNRQRVETASSDSISSLSLSVGSGIPVHAGDDFRGLDGIALRSDGAPVDGARITVFDDEQPGHGAIAEGESAGDGTFRIPLEHAIFVHAVAERAGLGRGVNLGTPFGHPFKITLSDGVNVEGKVTSEDGVPVALAKVEVADDATSLSGPLATTTDSLGHFQLEHVASRPQWVKATSRDGALVGYVNVAAEGAMQTDVVLHRARSVTLKLVDGSTRTPIVGAIVLAQSEWPGKYGWSLFDMAKVARPEFLLPYGKVARTDAAGRATLDGFAFDPLELTIGAEGYVPRVSTFGFSDGIPEIEDFLEPGCVAVGVARNVDGSPIAGAIVALDFNGTNGVRALGYRRTSTDYPALHLPDGSPNPLSLATTTASDGSFRLTGLPKDKAYLRLTKAGRVAFVEFEPRMKADVVGGIVITLGAKVKIQGSIRDEDGTAFMSADDVKIWVAPASEPATIERGYYSIECAPTAETTLWAAAPGYVHEKVVLDSMLTAETTVAITLKRGLSIRGRVVGTDDQGVANARVVAWPADPTAEEQARTGGWITEMNLGSTMSEADGSFTLRGLGDRPLRLVVTADGFASGSNERVAPGATNVAIQLARP